MMVQWDTNRPEFMYIGQWPIFHGPVILPYILNTIFLEKCHNWDIGSMWKIYLIKCMLVWPTFQDPMILSYILKTIWWINFVLEIRIQCYRKTELKLYICRSVTYISWSSDFALYLEDYLMGKCHNWNIGSMWCKDLPHKMYVGQWHTFHGPVILSYIEDYLMD